MIDPSPSPARLPIRSRWLRPAVFLAVIAAIVVLSSQFGDELSLERMAERETALRQLIAENPLAVYGGAFGLYVAVTGLSLPGATVMSVAYAWFFGFWPALVIVSFGSSIGATLAFLMSRFLFHDFVQRMFGERLVRFNEALKRDGAAYLFTLRLIPAVPYFIVNVVMGLTPIRAWTFYWVSQLGMLAGTIVFVYAGSSVGSLKELAEEGPRGLIQPQAIAALVLLGVFPLIVKWIVARIRWRRSMPPA